MRRIFFLILWMASAACNNMTSNDYEDKDTLALKESAELKPLAARRDERFVIDAIESGIEEMKWLGEGENRGSDTEVKSLARQMMQDHKQMIADLQSYANRKSISLDDIDTSGVVEINEKPGRYWDEEWADEIGDMHRRMIRRFDRARNNVQDRELLDMIDNPRPVLQSHLDMAQKLEARLDNGRTIRITG